MRGPLGALGLIDDQYLFAVILKEGSLTMFENWSIYDHLFLGCLDHFWIVDHLNLKP
jgi:hypothetical protein